MGASRFGAGLKAAGGSLIAVGVGLLCAYLRGKIEQAYLEKQMKKVEPKIKSLLNAKANKLNQLGDCIPFANITITIVVHYTLMPSEDGPEYDASSHGWTRKL